MANPKRLFIPFNQLMPDSREFNNEGLTQALNVASIGDTYIPARTWTLRTGVLPESTSNIPLRGLHVHPSVSANTWYGYYGSTAKLYEASNTNSTSPWTITNKSRSAGGAYTSNAWYGTSYGDAIIMTNGIDDPQILTSPTVTNFTKLAQSGGANPGMDPKAKFAFPVRDNMFLLNLTLSAGFDGLSAGPNPNVVCWAQDDNCRQYGSFNVTPQITGTDYQPLLYDFGVINGGVGGQYGLIALQRGWVRVDGPPYTFRPISEGIGCQFPFSIVRFDDDVYFWGPNGPMCFVGGEGPAIAIAKNKVSHTLLDPFFGGSYYARVYGGNDPMLLSAGCDHVNRHVWWTLGDASMILMYDIDSSQFSFQLPQQNIVSPPGTTDIVYLQTRPEQISQWVPGRDLVALTSDGDFGTGNCYLATPDVSQSTVPCVLEKGFMQLDPALTTRILRVRPVYSLTDNTTSPTASIDITSKNLPFQQANPSTYTGLDTHGWIVTPSTILADFHRVKLTLNAMSSRVSEIAGMEIEFITGGVFAA